MLLKISFKNSRIFPNEWGYTGAYVTDMINGADYNSWEKIWREIVFIGRRYLLHLLLDLAYAKEVLKILIWQEKWEPQC